MSKVIKSSLAKTAKFDHRAHADKLEELNTQAQSARRVDVALGLFCFELKEIHLQYGQFGKWLAEHRPNLARQDKEGNWKPSGSLESAMWMAKSALEVCGYKIGDYIELVQKQFPCAHGNCDASQLMLLPAAKLPQEFKKLRDEIFELVDGKSQRQLRQEFKQVDSNGNPKRGRVKGSNGNPKHIRDAGISANERHELEILKLKTDEVTDFLIANINFEKIAKLDEIAGGAASLKKFCDAIDHSHQFLTSLQKGRE
ncbi:MAG TPA: hypothetical protein VHY30_04530 [Verrucomicrobiae bacterium]|jgi:hypothetical protein|nr:hypothetical protein [Verrucomicrobiae bacterium]